MTVKSPSYFSILLILLLVLSGCYSFKGISIPADADTFYVDMFKNQASNTPPTLEQRFTETLKDKIRTESRLAYTDRDPSVEFKGRITRFTISSEAPLPGEQTAFNRLEISIKVEYINHVNEDLGWEKSFSRFFDFSTGQDFLSIQDEAVSEITTLLIEDIFNAAFTNW